MPRRRVCKSHSSASLVLSAELLNGVLLWKRAIIFGGVTSSAELPFYFSHASVNAEMRVKSQSVFRFGQKVTGVKEIESSIHPLSVAHTSRYCTTSSTKQSI